MATEHCWQCGAPDWIGRTEIHPPMDPDAVAWLRRVHCRHCGAKADELRPPAPLPVRSRHQPLEWRGGNPFEDQTA